MVEVTVLLIFPQRQWVDKVLVTNPSGHSPAFVERWLRQKKKKKKSVKTFDPHYTSAAESN